MAASNDILIVAESVAERALGATYELINAGLQVACQNAGRVTLLLLDEASDEIANELFARGVDRLYAVPHGAAGDATVEASLPVIVDVCRQVEPRLVLLAHGERGAELAPRLAFRLDGVAATGCVDVQAATDTLDCTRPCYGGAAREVDRFAVSPVVATLRAGVFDPAPEQAGRQGAIIRIRPAKDAQPRTRVLERTVEASAGVRLEDARVIVAGGRGLDGSEGFGLLEELARELDAAVGASRVPCDLGWCPHSWQIGLTGKTVTPELYIAVGISGAGHHMAGCGNAKTIVAINTDPKAAIFEDARIGVVGDYREVVPALAAELRKRRNMA